MIRVVANLISGTPPVAPPMDLGAFVADATLAEGTVVKLSASGKLGVAAQTMANAFGIALNAGTKDAATPMRVQLILPGTVLKGPVSAKVSVGTAVGLATTGASFVTNKTGCVVLKYWVQDDGTKMVLCIPTEGALFTDKVGD